MNCILSLVYSLYSEVIYWMEAVPCCHIATPLTHRLLSFLTTFQHINDMFTLSQCCSYWTHATIGGDSFYFLCCHLLLWIYLFFYCLFVLSDRFSWCCAVNCNKQCSTTMFPFTSTFRQDPHQGQIPGCLLWPPTTRARKRIPLHALHNNSPQIRTGSSLAIIGTSGKNLVPKPTSKGSKAKKKDGQHKYVRPQRQQQFSFNDNAQVSRREHKNRTIPFAALATNGHWSGAAFKSSPFTSFQSWQSIGYASTCVTSHLHAFIN